MSVPGVVEGGEAMTRKGGGRESGRSDISGEARELVPADPRSRPAAANPAAVNPARTPVYWHRQIIGYWHGARTSCVLCHLIEELRALEAELAALRKEAVKGSWRFRAEAAEARVKELTELVEIAATYVKTPIDKEQILDMLRNPNWREEWERKDAELHGEDQG